MLVTHCANPRDPSADDRRLAFVDPVMTVDSLVLIGMQVEYKCQNGCACLQRHR